MDQLETQAADLRYLTEGTTVPIAVAATTHAGRPNGRQSPRHISYSSASSRAMSSAPLGDNSALPPPPFSPGLGDMSTSAKRKQDDDEAASKQQRSKRNRYISIACNECKRRKIKCNGETPCQRCGNLNLACLYSPNCCANSFKDSEEYKHMNETVRRLEEQIDSLSQNVNLLRQETQRLAPLQDRVLPLPSSTVSPSPSVSAMSLNRPELAAMRPQPSFRGPTSIAFTVDVAKNTLHNMGYSGEAQDEHGPAAETPRSSPYMQPYMQPPAQQPSMQQPSMQPFAPQPPTDPLWEMDRDEIIRLCRVHEDEVGIMYPVVKIETVIEHAQKLTAWMDHTRHTGCFPPPNYDEFMTDIQTLLVKIIVCSALAVEEHGHSDRAIRLYESMHVILNRKLMSDPSDIRNLPFLALVAGYRFLSNDEVLAWRVMGQVARHCLEQGLHRREGLAKIADEQDRKNALVTFWSAYVLDRRWSFGTGLPYVVHDDKIDPGLPLPDEYPYLVAMISYSRLGAKIWKLVDFFEPAIIRDLKREEFFVLDNEILAWYNTVPEEVRINDLDRELPLPSTPSYNLQRLQIWTRLRLNQIRIWLHTPVLHSASSINGNMDLAQKVVDLAKDTIHYLSRLNNSTNLYRRIQVFYHQFLTSAIAVLFLASTHQPVQFSANCRTEFYMALNLIKDMSAKSWVSQRLWRAVRSLKSYAPRLGLQQDENAQRPAMGLAASSAGPASPAIMGTGSKGSFRPYLSNNSSISTASSSSSSNSGQIMGGSWQPAPPAPPPLPPPSVHISHGTDQIRPPLSMGTTTPTGQQGPTTSGQPDMQALPDQRNGVQLQSEMSRMFEGYMGMSGIPLPPAGVGDDAHFLYPENHSLTSRRMQPSGNAITPTDGVYEQLKELF